MQAQKTVLILVSVILSLFLMSAAAAAQVTGGTKVISGNTLSVTYGHDSALIPAAGTNTEVYDNHVTVQNNAITFGAIYGGYSKGNGDVYINTVEIVSGTTWSGVYGGYSTGNGDVYKNTVEIASGTLRSSVYGGYSTGNGDVYNNTVEIISGTSSSDVIGGYQAGSGNSNYNKVIIISSSVTSGVIGGASTNGDATGNQVEISGTGGGIYGGYVLNAGSASYNKVLISGMTKNVYGGYITNTATGDASYNTVEITSSASVGTVYGAALNNSTSSGIVDNNTVTLNCYAAAAFGGYSEGTGDVIYNTIIIGDTGSTVSVFGGITAGTGSVNHNTVVVNGTVTDIYGGWINNNTNSSADTNYNTVVIYGTVTGKVWAGFNYATGTANYNSVTIAETADVSTAELYGCNIGANGSGNMLNVIGFCGDVKSITNFDTFYFELGQLTPSLECINITGGTPVNIDGATINITFSSAFLNNAFSVGDVITVISDINLNATPSSVTTTSIFVNYAFTETYDTGALLLTVESVSLQGETKAVAEPFAASLAFLGQAADVRSSLYFVSEGTGFMPFATMLYGRQYIATGSSVTVKGLSALAGLTLNTNFDNGSQLVVGAFVEGGWGDYNSRNSFSASGVVKGKGDTDYYGGGLLVRYAMVNGLYGEGTFAAGKTETDFRSYDLVPGIRSKYDYSVPYYSAHAAIGQVLNLTDIFNLDVYGKYLWTRQAGAHVTVDSYRFKFKDADSHRLRAGGKLQADVSPQLQPYAGAAYEYEFSGRIKGSLYGMNLNKPSLRGGTGIGELGLVWTPKEVPDLKVDLGIQGYIGKREGVSGGLSVVLHF